MASKIALLMLLASSAIAAQQTETPTGGEYIPPSQHSICLTDHQREAIHQQLDESRRELQDQGILPRRRTQQNPAQVFFEWPVAKNPSAPYNSVWSISNHVDHQSNFPAQVRDYNCGTRTYDTASGYNHQGIDIYTWPFSWHQLQNDAAYVVAAAPGVIIGKQGNHFDMSCALNNNDWNAVYVQHSDGSVAWYGHLKKNSLTGKPVGSSVEVGEFLGVIGSSGNSTGPHLHFEVYNAQNQLVDPYAGTCNNWSGGASWWANQKPYLDPKINAVLTHDAPPEFLECPQTEVPNIRNAFAVGETVYLYVYLADQLAGTTANLQVRRPDNSIMFNFPQSLNNTFFSSYWGWTITATSFTQTGTYTVNYTYQGNTVTHSFTYGSLGTTEHLTSKLHIYPNPATAKINFSEPVENVSFINMDGKVLKVECHGLEADISGLPNGVYVVTGTNHNGLTFSRKLVK